MSAFNNYKQLSIKLASNKRTLIEIAKLLYELLQYESYQTATGEGGIIYWSDFLAQPEIGLTTHEASKLIELYRILVLQCGLDIDKLSNLPDKTIKLLLKEAKKGIRKNLPELLEYGISLSSKDFKELLHDYDNGIRTYYYIVMKKCNETGSMTKIHNIESDFIRNKLNLPPL